mmetsp:Transcript_28579/g.68798  ORF Transcript_28579/g.68798 Transcript_28579/m.68798 type:complete len:147 (+) Transcript_28579:89-529(+)
MNPFSSLFFILLACLCQSNALPGSWSGAKVAAFLPRGGAIGGRKGRQKALTSEEAPDNSVNIASTPESEDDGTNKYDDDNSSETSFDLQEVSKQLHKEEVAEIKKSQEFFIEQARRRELDTTWLDKGITAVIEFFENLFHWEVIDL